MVAPAVKTNRKQKPTQTQSAFLSDAPVKVSVHVERERISNPRNPREMVRAVTDILNTDNHRDAEMKLDHRVRKLIRQRVNAQQKLIEQIERNAKLRQELATLRGRRVT
jgi:hypothetical protein